MKTNTRGRFHLLFVDLPWFKTWHQIVWGAALILVMAMTLYFWEHEEAVGQNVRVLLDRLGVIVRFIMNIIKSLIFNL